MKAISETEKILENIGLKYLSKFETSEKQFKDFLWNKMLKINHELDQKEQDLLIKNILTKMKKLNYVNDSRYSELKSEQIFHTGGSKRMIIAKLTEKGIHESIVMNSLETLLKNNKSELISALIYIKKRRMGIFYSKNKNDNNPEELKKKWYGALARRGFSYDIVKKVLSIEDQFEAENIINRMKI